jgi:hypothetical protein
MHSVGVKAVWQPWNACAQGCGELLGCMLSGPNERLLCSILGSPRHIAELTVQSSHGSCKKLFCFVSFVRTFIRRFVGYITRSSETSLSAMGCRCTSLN